MSLSVANKKEQVDGLIQEGSKDTNTESGADTTMQMANQQQTGEDSSALDFRAEGESGFDTVTNSTILDGLNKQTVVVNLVEPYLRLGLVVVSSVRRGITIWR
ncbi:PREDICTED: uncharacterized protein LOC104773455 isoform X2 [Camelina sativa]|uniref:Uncharacterized protein LOC104773455 isoform X2 n=1 Tax=Camelina sativa TaxID=90675 RepID=A0ABM1RGS7_CAMSA|nr:PREDICTED: uncharacterized protein LOC104773455 isoform X2 [Camelina sativa]